VTASRRLLGARGVARRYGDRVALRPTDVDLCAGEAIALLGPNGAGKSTLLSILAGALTPTEGTVERAAGVRVGWMPQRPAHYGRLSARENLELFARLEREDDPRAAAARLLERLELPHDSQPSAALSVGNRQRLNLALSLLGSPDVLLLDEPTAALDPRQRRRLWETAAELRGSGGTVVFATQNLEDVERLADRVVLIVEGAVVFDGSVDDYDSSKAERALGA
jgi:ABC-type multidrug transport system ATPase subunit